MSNLKMKQPIKTLLFDLGGVLLDIDLKGTLKKLSELSDHSIDDFWQIVIQFDKGLLSPTEFRTLMKSYINKKILTDNEFDALWLGILLDFDPDKLLYLNALRKNYRLVLLSNTNALHFDRFHTLADEALKKIQSPIKTPVLESIFHSTYYSFKMKQIKPDVDIFKSILQQEKIIAEETLFLDDTLANIDTANRLGFNTLHIQDIPVHLLLPDYIKS